MSQPDSSEFVVGDTVILEIANTYQINQDTVKKVYKIYQEIAELMKGQYLAHVIRTMECKLRKETGNPFFQILCTPTEGNIDLDVACAQYFSGEYFSIFYNPSMDEKQLRVYLAHELGHLFLVEFFNAHSKDNTYDENTMTEPLSSIFGMFVILDKNHFYYNKTSPFKHKSRKDVMQDFSQLKNRSHGKQNIS